MCVGYFDPRQNHIYPFDGKLRATLLLVFKPLAERFDLLLRVRREKSLGGPVGGRGKGRLRLRPGTQARLARGGGPPTESHHTATAGLAKSMNVTSLNAPAS